MIIFIPLQSPSVRGITLEDAITEKCNRKEKKEYVMNFYSKEYVMNFYSKGFAERTTDQKAAARFAKAFHVLSDLIRYDGFDWIAAFRPLDDSKISEGKYRRHHFLALLFRKMSSRNAHLVTVDDQGIHNYYDAFLDKEDFQYLLAGEVYISSVLDAAEELMQREGDITPRLLEKAFIQHLGLTEGAKLFQRLYNSIKFNEKLDKLNEMKDTLSKLGPIEYLKKYFKETWDKFKNWIPTKGGKLDQRKIAEYIVKYQLGSWRDYNFIKYILEL